MTAKQFQKKIEIVRKTGSAKVGTDTLYYHGDSWSLEDHTGQTIDTCTHSPERYFDYMVD